ncbi:dual OB domain-containing protein [Clostridium felsineum]|uniref:Dual OB-containing domain-containing protein n=1 Tax=Clostridium felsineum TaxID=36839 RepID=A0A1S8LYM2_9CLOT|nr:hypothetical protein [Clostridium felsineum]URZ07525.1 hypothetical protein CLROS_028640 [Clostridium felsineum]URZ12556.1 hypothetical protein CROST_032790 [Clostridium felsineum]
MNKEIIILTKSEKYNNYCVAGIDVQTGQLVRLVSEDKDIKYALTNKDIEYDNCEEAQVLDKVIVNVKDNQKCWYQPENYTIDNKKKMKYIQKVSESDIDKYINHKDIIFFNNENSIDEEELNNEEDIYSLIMIKPQIFKVRIHNRKNKKKLKASILYNEVWYNNIIITDMEFTDKYYNEIMNLPIEGKNFWNVKIILSLAEKYSKDNKYYKLVASVIE